MFYELYRISPLVSEYLNIPEFISENYFCLISYCFIFNHKYPMKVYNSVLCHINSYFNYIIQAIALIKSSFNLFVNQGCLMGRKCSDYFRYQFYLIIYIFFEICSDQFDVQVTYLFFILFLKLYLSS